MDAKRLPDTGKVPGLRVPDQISSSFRRAEGVACEKGQVRRKQRRAIMRQYRCAVGLWATLAFGLAGPSQAEVHVAGSPAAVRITTNQDAISDVLSALVTTFNIRYRAAVPLDAAADATYSGSFTQVVSRLLDGYNYVMKVDRDSTEVIVYGRHGDMLIVPSAPVDVIDPRSRR
jgi:hypothetical protein